MVNKHWFREFNKKWFNVKNQPPPARCFSEPKWQDSLKLWYLLYRWLVLVLWLIIVVCSILKIGTRQKKQPSSHARNKWLIYLTNWDLSLGLIQALLAVVIVTRRWRSQRQHVVRQSRDNIADFDPDTALVYGHLEKIYYFFYVVTSSLAVGVTVIYWSLVHNPTVHRVDPLNLMIHVCNSLLMMLDLIIAGVPFQLRCVWWSPLFVSLYVIFSLVYYAAGGLDKRGEHRIYDILDWQKPLRTMIVCAGSLTFLGIVHCLFCFMAKFRDCVCERRRANNYALETSSAPADTDATKKQSIIFDVV